MRKEDSKSAGIPVSALEGFVCAGAVRHRGLNLVPAEPLAGRRRHAFGDGPFARLVMPPLPNECGLYAWVLDDVVVYLGQTRTPLANRLGSRGYSTISNYNTLAKQSGQRNGGQQTNCRINGLANGALAAGSSLVIWCRVTSPDEAPTEEATWMARHGKPPWNRRLEREA